MDFSASGRYMIAAGRKGHLALMDMKNLGLVKEFQVPCILILVWPHRFIFVLFNVSECAGGKLCISKLARKYLVAFLLLVIDGLNFVSFEAYW